MTSLRREKKTNNMEFNRSFAFLVILALLGSCQSSGFLCEECDCSFSEIICRDQALDVIIHYSRILGETYSQAMIDIRHNEGIENVPGEEFFQVFTAVQVVLLGKRERCLHQLDRKDVRVVQSCNSEYS